MAISDKLKYARDKSGLTLAEISQRISIGMSSISEFENGKRSPSVNQLQKFAKLYQRSLDFFLSDAPIEQEVVLWRKRPQADAENTENQFLELCKQYHNLEMWTNEKLTQYLPQETCDAENYSFPKAEALAKNVRNILALGDSPAFTLLTKLEENCGIKIFLLSFEPSGTAASTISPTFGPAILLNRKNVRWRRNFDLAHELFHLLTWDIFHNKNTCSSAHSSYEEQFADHFAGALLIPSDAIIKAIGEIQIGDTLRIEDYFNLARQFDVSTDALIWRLKILKLLEGQDPNGIIKNIKTMQSLYEKRLQPEAPLPWPERYFVLAVNALRQGLISIGRCAAYLGISRQEAMEFVKQEAYGDQEVSTTFA